MLNPFELKIGLALGGGAARGQAHAGVLKVFAEEQLPIHLIAGTSAGALVGALYCTGMSADEIGRAIIDIKWGDMVSFGFHKLGFFNTEKLERLLDKTIGGKCFEDTVLPFKVVAVDITSGEEVILGSGPIAPAVRASCSVPGIFEPVPWDNKLLVDGGIANSVPADVAREMGADYVIGVNLNGDRFFSRRPKNILDIINASFHITISNNTQKAYQIADLMVEPDLRKWSYHKLRGGREKARLGEEAARGIMETLKKHILEGGTRNARNHRGN